MQQGGQTQLDFPALSSKYKSLCHQVPQGTTLGDGGLPAARGDQGMRSLCWTPGKCLAAAASQGKGWQQGQPGCCSVLSVSEGRNTGGFQWFPSTAEPEWEELTVDDGSEDSHASKVRIRDRSVQN